MLVLTLICTKLSILFYFFFFTIFFFFILIFTIFFSFFFFTIIFFFSNIAGTLHALVHKTCTALAHWVHTGALKEKGYHKGYSAACAEEHRISYSQETRNKSRAAQLQVPVTSFFFFFFFEGLYLKKKLYLKNFNI